VVCNSCSVYFRPIEPCERCGTPSQKLTRISRFNDDLRVCPKCSTRDYETCPLCQKHRLLESDASGQKACKKCRDNPQKSCMSCHRMIAAGCADLCADCYWHKSLWNKFDQNQNAFEFTYLKQQYESYIDWLEKKVGSHKATLYINKHTHFFLKTEVNWNQSVPTPMQLLAVLRSSGLRKFELVMQWLEEMHGIQVDTDNKKGCSERDQMEKLVQSILQPSLAYDVVFGYKNKLEEKIKRGDTSIRSARLAVKPAVALMLSIGSESTQLPNLEHIKAYLADYSGQAAALTGFINFLNENYGTSIDYLKLKKSDFLRIKQKQKLEKAIVALAQTDLSNREELIGWVRNGLRYFHQLSYIDSLKVKVEMITEVNNGFAVRFNEQSYWLPNNQ
ncbi:transposase, partial [Acinetobacter baumannii]